MKKENLIKAGVGVALGAALIGGCGMAWYYGDQYYKDGLVVNDAVNSNVTNIIKSEVAVNATEQCAVVTEAAEAQAAEAAAAAKKSSSSGSGGSYYSSGGDGVLTRSGGVNYYNGRK